MFEKIRKIFILTILFACVYLIGFYAHGRKFFPYNIIRDIKAYYKKVKEPVWYYFESNDTVRIVKNFPEVMDWPLLITEFGTNDSLIVKVINNDGKLIHKWNIEWFDIWSDANHLPEYIKPRGRPGTLIHGIHLFDDGSIVFNFELCGLVRIDKFGNTLWKLPFATDHSVYFDGEVLWVCGQKHHQQSNEKYPYFIPPFSEPYILKVSPDGELLEETSVFDLLHKNKLDGLLYINNRDNSFTVFSGDYIHLNDVKPFPADMKEGFFTYGDVMISLRNSNCIVIYNDSTKIVKDVIIDDFVRQHDPDFFDGNHISIYDNYSIGSSDPNQQSRILIKSYINNKISEYYKGDVLLPFNSSAMGKHQWLENGNLLITDSMNGRAFEINERKEIVWEYRNVLQDRIHGAVFEVSRIHPDKIGVFKK
jgi:hypothetical protein